MSHQTLRRIAWGVAGVSVCAQWLFFLASPLILFAHRLGMTGLHAKWFGAVSMWLIIGSAFCIAVLSLRPRFHSLLLTLGLALLVALTVFVAYGLLLYVAFGPGQLLWRRP